MTVEGGEKRVVEVIEIGGPTERLHHCVLWGNTWRLAPLEKCCSYPVHPPRLVVRLVCTWSFQGVSCRVPESENWVQRRGKTARVVKNSGALPKEMVNGQPHGRSCKPRKKRTHR